MRNYLTIAGRDSRDFGVYISGQGTFSAPEKAYTFYDIPGRSGAIIGNDHRLENIEVSYECFIYTDFNQNIADFRSFLLSLDGYQRLTDSYHPDEFRLAVYVGPFEPEVTAKNDAGAFTLTFNCKPQRYLISGESTYRWVPGYAQIITGEKIDAFGPRVDTTTLIANISQYYTGVHNWYNSSYNALGAFSQIEIYFDGSKVGYFNLPGLVTSVEADVITGNYTITHKQIDLDTLSWEEGDASQGIFQTDSATSFDAIRNCGYYPVIDVSTAASVSDARSILNQAFSGVAAYNNILLIKEPELANKTVTDLMSWLTNLNGALGKVRIDGKLATPETGTNPYTYSPNYPNTFFSAEVKPYYNYAEHGYSGIVQSRTITMQYLPNDSMSNPTYFPSEPLIRVYGVGSFKMDGVTVTVSTCSSYTDIDCELMDCYEGSINRNNEVSFSTYDFPKLQPGDNEVNILSGITLIEMIPRWWRV